ncbi:MAG: hypothetical protein ABIQ31_03470 [Ferruginibacter sp.]
MQQIHPNINWLLSSKTIAFLKKSFLFSLFSSTLLYVLVRLFFYEFPFTIAEGFELDSKILLVIWIFLIACKLAFSGMLLVENSINKTKFSRVAYASAGKRTILIILTAMLAYAGKTQTIDKNNITESSNNSSEEAALDTDINFLIKLPS